MPLCDFYEKDCPRKIKKKKEKEIISRKIKIEYNFFKCISDFDSRQQTGFYI